MKQEFDLKMRIGVKEIVFVIICVFLLKITVADPMREKQKQKRHPASVRTPANLR